MTRKAGKRRIADTMSSYRQWREIVDRRSAVLTQPGAKEAVQYYANDVEQRILAGELTICTQALIATTMRTLQSFETGYYTACDMREDGPGTFHCASRLN